MLVSVAARQEMVTVDQDPQELFRSRLHHLCVLSKADGDASSYTSFFRENCCQVKIWFIKIIGDLFRI